MLVDKATDDGFNAINGSATFGQVARSKNHQHVFLTRLQRLREAVHGLAKLRRKQVCAESLLCLLILRQVLFKFGLFLLGQLAKQLLDCVRSNDCADARSYNMVKIP